jgi:hypothetical protein
LTQPGGFYRRLEERADGVDGAGLHAGEHVLVGLDGEGRGRVAEAFADDLDRDTGVDEQGRLGVAEVVQADAW